MDADDVAAALRAVAGDDVFCGARAIVDAPIHPQERALYTGVADSVRRATSTGRLVAREVLRNMGELQLRRLPVLNHEKRLVGIISLGDMAANGQTQMVGDALCDISQPGGQHSQTAH